MFVHVSECFASTYKGGQEQKTESGPTSGRKKDNLQKGTFIKSKSKVPRHIRDLFQEVGLAKTQLICS